MTFRLARLVLAAALCTAPHALASSYNGCPMRPAALCLELDLRYADLRNADLARADFSRSDLSGADLRGADLLSANLDQVKLNRANLAGANLEGADLKRAELYGANLRNARLTDANLHSADLNGAMLEGARLTGANLSGAHLLSAGLRNARLARADMTGALLSHADLRGADLTGANLRNATLTGTDLTGARLTGVHWGGASTRGCTGCPVTDQRADAVSQAPPPAAPLTLPQPVLGNGCWARVYEGEQFKGEALTLVGPAEVMNVRADWGFDWDPRFNALIVGPNATLTVYDNLNFRDQSATFKPGQAIPALDAQMGLFRTVRSLKVSCTG